MIFSRSVSDGLGVDLKIVAITGCSRPLCTHWNYVQITCLSTSASVADGH
jgi:hypothetical protein